MITQLSNNRYQDQNGKNCDAGVAIMGRTIDGNFTYKFLAIDANGNLNVNNGTTVITPIATANAPEDFTLPTGLKAAGVILGYVDVVTLVPTENILSIMPQVVLDANVGGSVNFVLIKVGTSLDTYTSGRVMGVDSWNPVAATWVGGVVCAWHNITMSAIGAGALKFSTANNTQEKSIYMTDGTYKIAIIVDTAITITGTVGYLNLQTATQITTI
jgi:hypothetical protein